MSEAAINAMSVDVTIGLIFLTAIVLIAIVYSRRLQTIIRPRRATRRWMKRREARWLEQPLPLLPHSLGQGEEAEARWREQQAKRQKRKDEFARRENERQKQRMERELERSQWSKWLARIRRKRTPFPGTPLYVSEVREPSRQIETEARNYLAPEVLAKLDQIFSTWGNADENIRDETLNYIFLGVQGDEAHFWIDEKFRLVVMPEGRWEDRAYTNGHGQGPYWVYGCGGNYDELERSIFKPELYTCPAHHPDCGCIVCTPEGQEREERERRKVAGYEIRFDPKVGEYMHFPVETEGKYCKRIADYTKGEVGVWHVAGDFEVRLNEDGSVDELQWNNKGF